MRFLLTLVLSVVTAAPVMLLLTMLQQPVGFQLATPQPIYTRLLQELVEPLEVYPPATEGGELLVPSPEGGTIPASRALFTAVADGDVAALGNIFAAGASTDVYNAEGSTPLIEAIRSENAGVIGAILDKGVDTNLAARNGGQTALSLALSQGNLDLATRLLDAGADINQKNDLRDTVLIDVLRSRPVNVLAVELLLARQPSPTTSSPDLNAVDASGVSLREIVADSGDEELIALFKQEEAAVPAAEGMGMMPDILPIIDTMPAEDAPMEPFLTLAPPPEPTFPPVGSMMP